MSTPRRELRIKPSGYVHQVARVDVGPANASFVLFHCGVHGTGFNTTTEFPVNAKRCTLCLAALEQA